MKRVLAIVLLVTATATSAAAAGNVAFDPEVSSQVETRRTANGLLMVRPLFDGEAVGWFLFDSAAAHCIDKSVAERLGLRSAGKITARTALAMIPTVRRRLGDMQLGPASFRDVLMTEIDLSYLSATMGEEIAGLIGIEVMDVCVVKVDRRAGRIDLFDPKLHEPKLEVWLSVIRRHMLACIEVKIEGHAATLKIDTGLDSAVLIYPAAAKRMKLLERRDVKAVQGGTVDGATEFSVVPLSSLEIGDAKIAGLLGGQVLDHFVLVMDLPRERVGFVLRETGVAADSASPRR